MTFNDLLTIQHGDTVWYIPKDFVWQGTFLALQEDKAIIRDATADATFKVSPKFVFRSKQDAVGYAIQEAEERKAMLTDEDDIADEDDLIQRLNWLLEDDEPTVIQTSMGVMIW